MKIGIAGARGSIPTPTGKTLFGTVNTHKYGGNTSCVYVQADNGSKHIFDSGTGIRDVGVYLAREGGFNGQGQGLNLYISHTHWDHIQGLPFFVPAYIGGNKISIYGEAKVQGIHPNTKESLEQALSQHSDQLTTLPGLLRVEGEGLQEVLLRQQHFRNFPVSLEMLKGIERFYDVIPGQLIYRSEGLDIDTLLLHHPGNSLSYRLTETKADGSKVRTVYSTDWEPNGEDQHERMVHFWENADVVISDAQYEPLDSPVKENPFMKGWGHSDFQSNLHIATAAHVKKLILFHLEPKMNDEYYDRLELRAQEAALRVAETLKENPVAVEVAKEGSWYEV